MNELIEKENANKFSTENYPSGNMSRLPVTRCDSPVVKYDFSFSLNASNPL